MYMYIGEGSTMRVVGHAEMHIPIFVNSITVFLELIHSLTLSLSRLALLLGVN